MAKNSRFYFRHIGGKHIFYFILFLGLASILGFSIFYNWDNINSYYAYNTSSLSYVRAIVTDINSENLTKDSVDNSKYLGVQNITVKILVRLLLKILLIITKIVHGKSLFFINQFIVWQAMLMTVIFPY